MTCRWHPRRAPWRLEESSLHFAHARISCRKVLSPYQERQGGVKETKYSVNRCGNGHSSEIGSSRLLAISADSLTKAVLSSHIGFMYTHL